MNFIKKNKILSTMVLFAGFATALSFSLNGISYNQLKYLRGLRSGRPSSCVQMMLQKIDKGVMSTPERSSEVAVLQERLSQCGELLEQYDMLLSHLGAVFGKGSFQIQEIVDEIYRLVKEKEDLKKERDEARLLLGRLANFAEDQAE